VRPRTATCPVGHAKTRRSTDGYSRCVECSRGRVPVRCEECGWEGLRRPTLTKPCPYCLGQVGTVTRGHMNG
jgi:hypothetical protein